MAANSVDGGCIGYVMAPTVRDNGGPKELETLNGCWLGAPLLVGVVELVVVVGGPPLVAGMLSV